MNPLYKPSFEKVQPSFGSSISFKHFNKQTEPNKAPFWHFHPEIQISYIRNGSGKRHIGSHISYYHSGDLVLIGSMLPHFGIANQNTGHSGETIVHFTDGFGTNLFSLKEMKDIRQLMTRAKTGLVFHGAAKDWLGGRIEHLKELNNFERAIELLSILQEMATTESSSLLNAVGYSFEIAQSESDRINEVFSFVQNNYSRAISLREIAEIANMTIPSFCRYFKKISGKNFTRFVNEIRIVQACKLLSEQQLSITNVAFETGFNNFSHFSRQFKNITGERPSDYRKQFKKVML